MTEELTAVPLWWSVLPNAPQLEMLLDDLSVIKRLLIAWTIVAVLLHGMVPSTRRRVDKNTYVILRMRSAAMWSVSSSRSLGRGLRRRR